jgi:hypothetical protein
MDVNALLPQVWQNSVNTFWNGVWLAHMPSWFAFNAVIDYNEF